MPAIWLWHHEDDEAPSSVYLLTLMRSDFVFLFVNPHLFKNYGCNLSTM